MTQNSCYAYFRITGDFDPDAVTEKLGLQSALCRFGIGRFFGYLCFCPVTENVEAGKLYKNFPAAALKRSGRVVKM